jgi:hypothetical protein
VNVLSRPTEEGIELTGHHEILLPLLHAAVACKLSAKRPVSLTLEHAAKHSSFQFSVFSVQQKQFFTEH